jgi:hypothetical protein
MLQPVPVIEADTVPLMDVDATVPEVDTIIVQPLHARAGKVME